MNEIPIADQILKKTLIKYLELKKSSSDDRALAVNEAMIEFAQIHVKAAIRAIMRVKYDRASVEDVNELTEDAINEFYPLENIK